MIDNSKLLFNSSTRYERIATKGSQAFSVGAFGTTLYTMAHNLGYTPYFKAYYTYGNGKYFQTFPGPTSYGIGGNGGQLEEIYVDTTNLYVRIGEYNGAPISGTIYYRIYEEPQV